MGENNEKHIMDIATLRGDLLAINVKIDTVSTQLLEKVGRIEEQTVKTNGRVSALEKWKWAVVGGGSVFMLVPALEGIITVLTK